MCISYSIVPNKKEDSGSCHVCHLSSAGKGKQLVSVYLCEGPSDLEVQQRRWTRIELYQLAVYGEQ
jgi:hypothetical protein